MLNKTYLDIIKEVKEFKAKLEKEYADRPTESFEDKQTAGIIEYLKDELEEAVYDMEMYTRETIEGEMVLNSQGRFNLNTAENIYFTCGSPVEMYIDGKWHNGRVEHNGENYYFCGYDTEDRLIEEGMKARIRVDKK